MASGRVALIPLALLLRVPTVAAAVTCEALRFSAPVGTEIVTAATVPARPAQVQVAPGEPARALELPAHCRIAGVIRPTSASHIRFELWMPVRGWTGRFEGVGNGNYAGMLSAGALPYGVIRGSAIAATDTGHESTPADPRTAHWAGSREQLIDFGHREVHLTASVAKKIVSAFYGTPARHSYFVSCSNGGRQGLMSALRYPEDFDGIVAGAPARSWTRLNSTFMSHHKRYVSDPERRLPEQKVQLLAKATTAACDAVDGVLDGIVDDPRTCTFDAAMLRCDGDESENCLTAKQLETVRLLRAGTSVPPAARLAGLPAGTESDAWSTWVFGRPSTQSGFEYLSVPFFRDFLYRDPDWTPAAFDLERDSAAAKRELAPILDADDPDLTRYFARGGKLILYAGWLDPAIPALDTIEYYEALRGRTGTGRPHEDVRAALFDWVENGRAPEQILAARQGESLWTDPRADMPRGNELPTRPLCAYPNRARWTGRGSTDDAANFLCVAPDATG
jgi:feruloyl esterase